MSDTVRVLTGTTALAFLAGTYRGLYQHDPNATAYQDPAWLVAWAQELPSAATPLLLVADDRMGNSTAALALVHDTSGPRERLYPLSAPNSDYVRASGPGADTEPV